MSMTSLVLLHTILLVFANSLTPLQEFEIDGNYYSDGLTDWITVLDGYRINRESQTNWAEYQNQCFKDPAITNPDIYTDYWDSGVFCDTFGNDEQSLLAVSDDTRSFDWVELNPSSAGAAKYDLTNAYYAGNGVDMIMCAAMERIVTNGESYVDFEFPQIRAKKTIAEGCSPETYYNQEWKCWYPLRSTGDMQISFDLSNMQNGAGRFTIRACEWDESIVAGSGGCGDAKWVMIYEAVSEGGTAILDGPIKGAINEEIIQASPFQFIYQTREPYYTDQIPVGAFLETCIDWRALNRTSMCYAGVIVKTKASKAGSLKDTSGVIPFSICGNVNMTHSPTNPPPTNPPTKMPTRAPIRTPYPTLEPTGNTPPPTWNPSVSPTDPTVTPSVSPSEPSINPTKNPTISPTLNPTQSPSNPTNNPITLSPTNNPITSSPTQHPVTLSPTDSPTTSDPTSSNPSRPPSASPTLQPSQPTKVPTINTDPTASPNTNAPTTAPISLNPTTSPVTNTDPTASPIVTTDPTVSPNTEPTAAPIRNGDPTAAPNSNTSPNPTTSPNTNTNTNDPTTAILATPTDEDGQGEDEGLGSQPEQKSNVGMIVAIVGALIVLCCCLLFGALFWLNKRNREKEDALDVETLKLSKVKSMSGDEGPNGTAVKTPSSLRNDKYGNDEDDDEDEGDDEEDFYEDDESDEVSDLEKNVEMADLKKKKKR